MQVTRASSPFLPLMLCNPSGPHSLLPQSFVVACRYCVCVRQRDTAKQATGVDSSVVRDSVRLGFGSDLVMQGSCRGNRNIDTSCQDPNLICAMGRAVAEPSSWLADVLYKRAHGLKPGWLTKRWPWDRVDISLYDQIFAH